MESSHNVHRHHQRGLIAACLTVAFIAISLGAHAQSAIRPVGLDGTCPPADQLARLPEVRNADFGVGYSFVILPDQALYQEAVPFADKLTIKATEFARAHVFAATPDRGDRVGRVLIRFERPIDRCGWIDRTALLLPDGRVFDNDNKTMLSYGPRPLKVAEGPSRYSFLDSGLTRKIIVQNAQSRENDSGTIPVFDKAGGQQSGTVRLLETFDLFQEQTSLPADTPGVKKKYLLIGGYDDHGRSFLKGWLREDDGLEWNTRIAVFWAGTHLAVGYRDRAMKNDQPGAVVREPPNFLDPPDHIVPRFPVLSQDPDSETISKQFTKGQDPNAKVNYYEVAVPGRRCDPNDPTHCIANDEYIQRSRDMDTKVRAQRSIDLMFVIARTDGMHAWWRATAEAVHKFVNDFTRELGTDLDMRIGAATYGDYLKTKPGLGRDELQFDILIPLTDAEQAPRKFEVLSRLGPNDRYVDPQYDYPDASLAALEAAADQTQWGKDVGFRVIVQIGDHGARRKGEASERNPGLREFLDPADVADHLADRNVGYIGVAVRGNYRKLNNDKFVEDANAIVARLLELNKQPHDWAHQPVVAPPPSVGYQSGTGRETTAPADSIYAAISAQVRATEFTRGALEKKLACARDPADQRCREPTPASSDSSGHVTPADQRIDQLVTRKDEDLISMRATGASYFFRPTVNGRNVFTYWIALNPAAALGLVSVANDTCANFRLTSMGDLRHLWEQALMQSSGETNQYNSPADMASKRLAIPAYALHPLLSKSFDQIQEELNVKARTDKPGLEEIEKHFCLSAKLISGIRDGVKYDPKALTWETGTKSWSGSGKRYDWRSRSESGVELLYVPFEYLP